LNVRGGRSTGGFLEGGSDEHLSSFLDHTTAGGNHSWGEFADLLKANGFEITEVREGPNKAGCDASKAEPCSDPVDFDALGLEKFDVVILGSNNSRYSRQAVAALLKFVDGGGGAVFLSDGNFGRNWGDAPNSDQSFLDSVGWSMNQDGGTYTVGYFDRNTFFNANGAGTNLGRFDNKILGLNLLRWARTGLASFRVLFPGGQSFDLAGRGPQLP
jgi:hypothetical protein